eukprot:COSAG02_NODE_981_length_15488_cov_27.585093_7_plen_100_part_00
MTTGIRPYARAPGTGFDGTASTAQSQNIPKFNQRVYAYIESLPRGEKRAATNILRQYVYGPGRMQPDEAIERYKDRRVRDARSRVAGTSPLHRQTTGMF